MLLREVAYRLIRWIVQSCGDKKKLKSHTIGLRRALWRPEGDFLGGGLYFEWPITSLAQIIVVQTHLNGCWLWQAGLRSITQLNNNKHYVFLLIYLVFIIVYSKIRVNISRRGGALAPSIVAPPLLHCVILLSMLEDMVECRHGVQVQVQVT